MSSARNTASSLKRPQTLTLDADAPPAKQKSLSELSFQEQAQVLLASPDLSFLRLASPDLERMLITPNGVVATPTPSQLSAFTKGVSTEEQDRFVHGFLEALQNIRQQHQGQEPSLSATLQSVSAASGIGANSKAAHITTSASESIVPKTGAAVVSQPYYPSALQIVNNASTAGTGTCSSDNASPAPDDYEIVVASQMRKTAVVVDIGNQDRARLDRKRARNREAAARCRNKKMSRISTLEEQVQDLKTKNGSLAEVSKKLQTEVNKIKQQIVMHVKTGCQIMITSNMDLNS